MHFFQKMVNFKYAKKPYISMVCGVFGCYVFLIHGFIHYFWKLDKHTALCIIIQTVSAIYNVAFFVPTFWFFTMYIIYFSVLIASFVPTIFTINWQQLFFWKTLKRTRVQYAINIEFSTILCERMFQVFSPYRYTFKSYTFWCINREYRWNLGLYSHFSKRKNSHFGALFWVLSDFVIFHIIFMNIYYKNLAWILRIWKYTPKMVHTSITGKFW